MSRKTDIANAIKAKLETIPELKKVTFTEIKVALDDITDDEVPFLQFWDGGETIQHQRQIARKTWRIFLELVMKSTNAGTIDQTDVWDLQNTIETTLWSQPNLGVSGMVHLFYVGSTVDLHMNDPVRTLTMEIQAIYDDTLVPC